MGNKRIQVATFRGSFDVAIEHGKPNFKHISDIKVVTKGDLTLYFVEYPRDITLMNLLEDGTYEPGEVTYDTIRRCYILEKGAMSGLHYDSLSAASGKKFDADSVLTGFNMSEKHFGYNTNPHGKLVFSSYDEKTGKLLVEKFFSDKEDEYDSTYRFYDYSKIDMKVSLAPELDKSSGSKVAKVSFIVTPKIKGQVKTNRDELSYEIIRRELTNKEEILQWIEKYNKDKVNLKK
ncbi:MAG: hypothetical protein EOO90_24365 [Pedobacter sp.]|nr:MAG: hypothetical protein EOO90_24365 [Pedobacter sp.]